jgi:hypothetical protein
MPMENTTSNRLATCSSPCNTFLAKLGNWLKNTAPKNHIQLMPSSERNTTKLPCASFRLRQVSVTGFQLMRNVGSCAGVGGMNSATTRPSTARPSASQPHVMRADLRHGNDEPTRHVPQQNGHKGAHFDHAVAAHHFAFVQVLGQIGKLDRTEQGGVHAHQERAGQQHLHPVAKKAPGGQRHDGHLQPLHKTDEHLLVVLVGQLATGGRKQQNGRMNSAPITSPAIAGGSHATCNW